MSVEPEQPSINLRLVETETTSVRLAKSQIIEFWELGIFSNLAFIHLAIEYEKRLQDLSGEYNLHIDRFVEDWRGISNPDTGKAKTLSTLLSGIPHPSTRWGGIATGRKP